MTDNRSAPPATHLGGPRHDDRQGSIAGRRRRLASMLYESMLMLGVLGFGFMVPQIGYSMATKHTAPSWFLVLHIYLLMGSYFIWYWRRQGQTLSMQTWKLKLVNTAHGGPISLAQAILRYTLAWPSVLLFGMGLIWCLLDREKQFLHDRLAGTRIVFHDPRATL